MLYIHYITFKNPTYNILHKYKSIDSNSTHVQVQIGSFQSVQRFKHSVIIISHAL